MSMVSLLRGGSSPLLTSRARLSLSEQKISSEAVRQSKTTHQIAAVGTGKLVEGRS